VADLQCRTCCSHVYLIATQLTPLCMSGNGGSATLGAGNRFLGGLASMPP
jgi:hypothetical protein